jgi:hypothetical protein
VLPDGKVLAVGSWYGPLVNQAVPAAYRLDLQSHAFVASGFIDFGAQSWGTTSPATNLTVRNTAAGTRAITVTSSAGFPASTDCTTLAPGASCTVSIRHRPAAPGATLGAYTLTSGSATITGGTDLAATVALTGAVSYALVEHYYRSSLRRAPDAAGRQYWVNEAIRIRNTFQSLSGGAASSVSEAWYALAMTFFGSPEYVANGRDGPAFVADLYRTFFDREPDAAGLAHWSTLLARGLPREAVLASFMFSAEFMGFNTAFYGGGANRPEVDTVMDLYRGFFARLPDDAGLAYWVGRMRQAQCIGAQAVTLEVDSLSHLFANSGEYASRQRSTSQFVADLYNAFMRRGADPPGVAYWVQQLDGGSRSHDDARRAFVASPEFQARVQSIIAAGCP